MQEKARLKAEEKSKSLFKGRRRLTYSARLKSAYTVRELSARESKKDPVNVSKDELRSIPLKQRILARRSRDQKSSKISKDEELFGVARFWQLQVNR